MVLVLWNKNKAHSESIKKTTYHICAVKYREQKIENTKQDQECCNVALYECFQPTGSVFVPIPNPSSILTNASSN
ncbi:LOW QUALITY PROTEIN: hypothetical protein TorRG33x02_329510 [Trema orientale]|uniref:Uncharacterized protein n=1 Tax=Trema orientale TaxID=63057 RepID=A0A2P5B8H7_TREOI|nr:LOW QUALITY PROTEIN: hypothetical protein TorRG33x02_329510 [Trema orientale]